MIFNSSFSYKKFNKNKVSVIGFRFDNKKFTTLLDIVYKNNKFEFEKVLEAAQNLIVYYVLNSSTSDCKSINDVKNKLNKIKNI